VRDAGDIVVGILYVDLGQLHRMLLPRRNENTF
jgi:hypothetical protein